MVEICALGSGSKGNSFVLSCGGESIIVDIGFSRRETCTRMKKLGMDGSAVSAALLTHEHSDHSKGCRVFCDEYHIPLYTASATAEYLRRRGELPGTVHEFEPGDDFEIGGFAVEPFAVQHDAVMPVGYIVRCDGCKIGIATDLGAINRLAAQRLHDCDALILESNYDAAMLRDSQRSLELKRRIFGRRGHLDNHDALDALSTLMTRRTRILLLAHLSEECNSRDMVSSLFCRRLRELGREDVFFTALSQGESVGPLQLRTPAANEPGEVIQPGEVIHAVR